MEGYFPKEIFPNDPPLPEGMSEEAGRAYAVVIKGLAEIHAKTDLATVLEACHGAILGAGDYAQIASGSPVVAHDLLQNAANIKWLAMLAGKKNRGAA